MNHNSNKNSKVFIRRWCPWTQKRPKLHCDKKKNITLYSILINISCCRHILVPPHHPFCYLHVIYPPNCSFQISYYPHLCLLGISSSPDIPFKHHIVPSCAFQVSHPPYFFLSDIISSPAVPFGHFILPSYSFQTSYHHLVVPFIYLILPSYSCQTSYCPKLGLSSISSSPVIPFKHPLIPSCAFQLSHPPQLFLSNILSSPVVPFTHLIPLCLPSTTIVSFTAHILANVCSISIQV